MAASRFSSDVLQLFCGPIPQEKKLSMDGFVCGKWMSRPGYPYKGRFLQSARKAKERSTDLIENEIAILRSIKTQFGLLVKFSIIRDNETILELLFLSETPRFDFQQKQ